MIEIQRILLFDDNGVDEPYKYVTYIKKAVLKYFKTAKGLADSFKISKDVKVEFYYFRDWIPEGYKITCESEEELSVGRWDKDLEKILENCKGCLVLCDFQWAGELNGVRDNIYNGIKNREEMVFVCYSTVLPQNAQKWIDIIEQEEHSCTLVNVALSMPKDMELKIKVLEEAIQDVW